MVIAQRIISHQDNLKNISLNGYTFKYFDLDLAEIKKDQVYFSIPKKSILDSVYPALDDFSDRILGSSVPKISISIKSN